MDRTYWHKQTAERPLFPDLLWSRPENKAHAGKLLIVGGNVHGFAAPAEAYSEAVKAGAGLTRVLLPQLVKRLLPSGILEAEYAPATPSGSFSRQALAELLDLSVWADGVLLSGDFGRNSETAIVLEQFAGKYRGQLTLAKDAADYFISAPQTLLQRPDTLLVLSFAQLQKLAVNVHFSQAFTFDMDLLHLVDALHEFTTQHCVAIIVKHLSNIFVSISGQVSSTKLTTDQDIWRVRAAAHASVWRLQNPAKPLEASSTAVFGILPKSD